ncbi:Rieske (2Fe-2S) protein [Terricaulis silvestris]|uniref:Rieske [2Fe-2S] domain protein n=1 Tax=Terricaulis silvestris TaxID=2686094 RepID=A0A6I6MYY3_9CAUL|nr:Rieske (2Fe-2S) protein [Terricaulis silvestris]QGZ96852.1 Rieske [2Fe-2S] domain protein [Terricaulis silvestris]
MTPGHVLARLADLADPCAIVVRFEDDPFASVVLTRRGDVISAFRNKCPHAGYPLQRADGRIVVQEGRYMVCAAHGASFGLEDGACAGGPCNGDGLERIAVVVSDGIVSVA